MKTTTTLKKKVNLPFSYAGSKASMITNLLSILPTSINFNERAGILELFCGSAIFSFNVMHHFQNVFSILNDRNDLVIKVFFEIQNNCDKLIDEFKKNNISSETLFNKHLKRQCDINETDFDRAISYLYTLNFSMTQRETDFHASFHGSLDDVRGFGLKTNFEKIKNVEQYLQRCIINNTSFDNFLKRNKKYIEIEKEKHNILLFVDPPYLDTRSSTDNIDYKNFNETDMQRLLDYLDTHCKIPFIFCHFPHSLIENWAIKNGHTINKFSKNSNSSVLSSAGKSKEKKTEWFITNYNTFYEHE